MLPESSPVQFRAIFGELRTEPHSLIQFGLAYISRTMVQVQFSSASESVHTEIFLFYSARACVSSNFDEAVWVPPKPRAEQHSSVQFSSASELVLELNSGNTSAVTLP